MKVKCMLLMLSVFAFSLTSCSKDKSEPLTEGTYKGTFSVSSSKNTGTLVLNNGKFRCKDIPYACAGTYSLEGNKIVFSDTCVWTADFDWRLIFKGEYKYSFDGKELTLERGSTPVYKCVLNKQ